MTAPYDMHHAIKFILFMSSLSFSFSFFFFPHCYAVYAASTIMDVVVHSVISCEVLRVFAADNRSCINFVSP